MKISIIVPSYNNAKSLKKLLPLLQKVNIQNYKKEIIVINDASQDNTKSILSLFPSIISIHHKTNTGKGGAVRSGINKSTGTILCIQDDDMEYDPREIPKLIEPILYKRTDVVYGSRRLNKRNTYTSWLFYAGGVLTDTIVSIIVGNKLTDSITGAKAFTRKAYESIAPITSNGFEIEAELTVKFVKHGYIPFEIPIKYSPRSIKQGKNIRWHHVIPIIGTAIKYRYFSS